jgi:hypothetical protein
MKKRYVGIINPEIGESPLTNVVEVMIVMVEFSRRLQHASVKSSSVSNIDINLVIPFATNNPTAPYKKNV